MAMKLSDEHKQVVYWIGGIFAVLAIAIVVFAVSAG